MELKSFRQQKMDELHKQKQAAEAQDFVTQQLESAKKTVLQRFLTKEARERLATVKAARPELANMVEMAIFDAAQAGGVEGQIDDARLKEILSRATNEKKNFRIIK